jgi:hypothetical protein
MGRIISSKKPKLSQLLMISIQIVQINSIYKHLTLFLIQISKIFCSNNHFFPKLEVNKKNLNTKYINFLYLKINSI